MSNLHNWFEMIFEGPFEIKFVTATTFKGTTLKYFMVVMELAFLGRNFDQ